jgi:peptidyl-prolyl cis-trans isomerase C
MKARYVKEVTGAFLLVVATVLVGCDIQPNPERIKAATETNQDQQRVRKVQMPEILATVDGVPITRAAFQSAIKQTIEFYRSQGMQVPVSQVQLLQMVMDQLIAKELVYQEARSRGMDAEAEVDQMIAEAKEKAGSEEQFQAVLQQRGVTEEQVREATRRQVLTERIIDEELTSKVEITPEMVEKFYEDNPQRFVAPERIRARHILISIPQGAPESVKEEARAKIDELAAKLAEGADFATLAKQESEDQASAANGGDLGFFTRNQMPPAFAAAAFSLEPGQVSDVVETSFGYHLIYVEERLPEQKIELNDDVRGAIRLQLTQDQVKDKLRIWAEELEGKHDVERFFNLSETLEQVRRELEAEAAGNGPAASEAGNAGTDAAVTPQPGQAETPAESVDQP